MVSTVREIMQIYEEYKLFKEQIRLDRENGVLVSDEKKAQRNKLRTKTHNKIRNKMLKQINPLITKCLHMSKNGRVPRFAVFDHGKLPVR